MFCHHSSLGNHFWLWGKEMRRDGGENLNNVPLAADLVNKKMKTPTWHIISEVKEVVGIRQLTKQYRHVLKQCRNFLFVFVR